LHYSLVTDILLEDNVGLASTSLTWLALSEFSVKTLQRPLRRSRLFKVTDVSYQSKAHMRLPIIK